MKHIRPWQLFEKLDSNREVSYTIPSVRGRVSETISSLETLLLIASARIVKAKAMLEFGTCLGYNALHLARNLDIDIDTIDRERKPHVFDDTPQMWRIFPAQIDIFELGVGPSHYDMVFCDINYTVETLARCTELALRADPKMIGWHDYGHPELPHVKPFLDAVSEHYDLVHVEDSSLVLWFKEPFL